MKRKRTSVIWKIDNFEDVVKNATSYTEILNHANLKNKGGNINTVKKRIKEEGIDDSHIPKGCGHNAYRKIGPKLNLDEFIRKHCIQNGKQAQRGNIKKRLLDAGIIENRCSICGIKNEWNGIPIVMILDHINGISNDHRIDNLRMVCPNCNSQLDTHCGKSKRKLLYYCECGKEKGKSSASCKSCAKKNQRKVMNRPDKQEIKKIVDNFGYCAAGRRYGVSDNTIRKWIKA